VTKFDASGTGPFYGVYVGGDGTDIGEAIAIDPTGAAYLTGSTSSSDFATPGAFDTSNAGQDAFVSKLTPVILPESGGLVYSTYLGGSVDEVGNGIAVDPAGAAAVAGSTSSGDFPTANPVDSSFAADDAFVSRLNPGGNALPFSTRLGGSDSEQANGIGLDSSGAMYLTGLTLSSDFDTVGPIEGDSGAEDVFVSKIGEAQPPGGPSAPPTPSGRCAGRTATQTGTTGPDVITGTQGPDVIAGLAGNDLVRGLGGKDLICGDAGRDRLNGGKGKDRLLGLAGRDRLAGGKGLDKLKGGGGKDKLSGGPQRDVCMGGPSKDRATACERRRSI